MLLTSIGDVTAGVLFFLFVIEGFKELGGSVFCSDNRISAFTLPSTSALFYMDISPNSTPIYSKSQDNNQFLPGRVIPGSSS